MAELITTRCKQGKLIITDTSIIVELLGGAYGSQTMARSQFTGLDVKLVVPSVFGLGGGCNVVFHGQGNASVHAGLVKPKIVKQIRAMLTGR